MSNAFALITGFTAAVLWTCIAACICVVLWAMNADAAVHPDTTMPIIRPEMSKEGQKPKKATCAKQNIVILYGDD